MNNRFGTTIAITILCLLSLSCGLTFSSPDEEPQVDLAATQQALSATQIALAVQQTSAAQQALPVEEPRFEYNGISLALPAQWSMSAEIVPSDLDMESFWGSPEHERLNVLSYPILNDYHDAHISIFPVDVYSAESEIASERIADLSSMLANRPANPQVNELPFLPIFNAGMLGMFKFDYLDFQSGSGVRYVTQFGQAFFPFNNEGMVYTFQGLTSDGRFYVSALLPVSHPTLGMYSNFELSEDFYDNAEQFLADQMAALDAQSPDSFSPTLSSLDAMLSSLRIDK